jgi:hypothetical protein
MEGRSPFLTICYGRTNRKEGIVKGGAAGNGSHGQPEQQQEMRLLQGLRHLYPSVLPLEWIVVLILESLIYEGMAVADGRQAGVVGNRWCGEAVEQCDCGATFEWESFYYNAGKTG